MLLKAIHKPTSRFTQHLCVKAFQPACGTAHTPLHGLCDICDTGTTHPARLGCHLVWSACLPCRWGEFRPGESHHLPCLCVTLVTLVTLVTRVRQSAGTRPARLTRHLVRRPASHPGRRWGIISKRPGVNLAPVAPNTCPSLYVTPVTLVTCTTYPA